MILGDICTRNCAFCGCEKGRPKPIDAEEPRRVAEAVKKLNLKYVVITSVTRDDLPLGGAEQFANVISALRVTHYPLRIEILIPDFKGNKEALDIVINARPDVINHNVETVKRLHETVRPQANYQRSLNVLLYTKETAQSIYTKSGFMVGLGETDEEVLGVLSDLRSVGCDIVTIGQYLPPSNKHPKVDRYVEPESFAWYERVGKKMGFYKIFSGPFVRSSYRAGELVKV